MLNTYSSAIHAEFCSMNYSNFIIPDSFYNTSDMDNISPAPDMVQLHEEVEQLKAGSVILSTYPYILIVCNLHDKPALSHELGRQREMTFRLVGESTGEPIDIDKYDQYYDQLIIWDINA